MRGAGVLLGGWLVVWSGCSCSGENQAAGTDAAEGDGGGDGDGDGGMLDAAGPDATPGPPVVLSFELRDIGGITAPPVTFEPTLLAHVQASDGDDLVVAFCARASAAAPAADDDCWTDLTAPTIAATPAADVTFIAPVPLGYVPGSITTHAWVKDQSGLVSAPVSPATVLYDPGTPPVISAARATRTEAPCAPAVPADVNLATTSDDLFIKWNAAFPESPAATPIRLEYTEDGASYTFIADVADAAGAGCSLGAVGIPDPSCSGGLVDDTAMTGCFRWTGTKPSGPFHVRVRAIDGRGLRSTLDAVPMLNAAPIRILVGSTDSGIDGDARNAPLDNHLTVVGSFDFGSVAMSSRGDVYHRDRERGLLWFDPQTRAMRLLARLDRAAALGADGAIGTATVVAPGWIAVDGQDRLWVWDRERIRRVEVGADRRPTSIVTVIGGGSDQVSNGVAPDQVAVPNCASCSLVPVGDDVWFHGFASTSLGFPPRVYRGASGLVDAVPVSGSVDLPAVGLTDIATCLMQSLAVKHGVSAVDRLYLQTAGACGGFVVELSPLGVAQGVAPTAPSVFPLQLLLRTGIDGQVYLHGAGSVFRMADDGLAWQRIIGTGTPGQTGAECADGTADSACPMAAVDLAIDAFGRPHWIEGGRLRAVDAAGAVVSVLGRSLAASGVDALRVRLPSFEQARDWTAPDGSRRLVIADAITQRYREAVVGGTIVDIAGNGVSAPLPATLPVSAAGQSVRVSSFSNFEIDVLGRVYHPMDFDLGSGTPRVVRLDRGVPGGEWQHLIGGGATPYATAPDGTDQSQLSLSVFYASVFSVTATDVVMAFTSFSGSSFTDGMLERYGIDEPRVQTHLAGTVGPIPGAWCADGTPAGSCGLTLHPFGWSRAAAVHDPVASRWIVREGEFQVVLRTLPENPAQSVGTLIAIPFLFSSFTYVRDGGDELIYFCASSSGVLARQRIGDPFPELLPWPIASMRCAPLTLRHDPARNALLFTFSDRGRSGVAEYALP